VTHSSVEEKKIEPQMDVNERRWKRKMMVGFGRPRRAQLSPAA